jgi:hypothetical protein
VDVPPAGRVLARHWLFAVLLVVGVVLRATSSYGVGPAQLVGLGSALLLYLMALYWGCWSWLAALAAAPALLDQRMLVDQPDRLVVSLVLLCVWVILLGLGPSALVQRASRDVRISVFAVGCAAGLGGLLVSQGQHAVSRDPGVLALHLPSLVLFVMTLLGLGAAPGMARATLWPLWQVSFAAAWGSVLVSGLSDVVWAPLAGALGLTALLRGRRGRAAGRPQSDEVDDAALAEFRDRYGELALGPVVIVIAAYNEADGIPGVLTTLPEDVCGLHADVVVVDDGSSDGTAAALEGTRAHVVVCGANRGQGAALRLGYRIAREHGAAYVVTTDADGQYDAADLPAVVEPLVQGRADFVSGSRILGHQQTRDRVRRTGVHVFAWLATILTGHRFTDTSFGLRAMRAEVTAAVTLNQQQYQSSELLLGAFSHGFRMLEVPATMNLRSAGSTKKGKNLVYGRRYARAMVGTWLREGLPRPVTETAPALRQTRRHGD